MKKINQINEKYKYNLLNCLNCSQNSQLIKQIYLIEKIPQLLIINIIKTSTNYENSNFIRKLNLESELKLSFKNKNNEESTYQISPIISEIKTIDQNNNEAFKYSNIICDNNNFIEYSYTL